MVKRYIFFLKRISSLKLAKLLIEESIWYTIKVHVQIGGKKKKKKFKGSSAMYPTFFLG